MLGFELRQRYGHQAAFLAADGCHHHIGLNGPTWEGRCAGSSSTGWIWTGASDHGGPEALYLHDPDAIGIELHWDRPREEWPLRPDGSLAMVTEPLDPPGLLAAADPG